MKWNTEINLDEHNIWFTSDLHLYHANILHMNNRPFSNCDEMLAYFIEEWNSKVNPNDYAFILGDVLWGSQATRLESLSKLLNGMICIELGNHDKEKTANGATGSNFQWFHSVERADNIKVVSEKRGIKQDIFLSHYPAISWPGKSRGSFHLHGHVHGNMDKYNEESTDLRLDVGVDSKFSYMKLASFDDVYEYFKKKAGTTNFAQYMSDVYKAQKEQIIL